MKNYQFLVYVAAIVFFLYLSFSGILNDSSGWFAALLLVLLGLYRLLRRK